MTVRNKTNLSIIIFLAAVVLMVAFVLWPVFKKIESNSKELISQKGRVAAMEAKMADLEKFKIFSKESREIVNKADSLFVNSKVPVEFIGFLEKDSQECNLDVEMIPLSAGKEKNDPWPSLSFQLNTEGLFSDFLRFLERLENSPYLIEIQRLRSDSLAGGQAYPSGQVRATLTIKVFSD